MGHNNKITLACFRISTLELIIEDIQVRHQSDMKSIFGYNPTTRDDHQTTRLDFYHNNLCLESNHGMCDISINTCQILVRSMYVMIVYPMSCITTTHVSLSPSSSVGSSSPVRMAPKRTSTSTTPTMTQTAIKNLVIDSIVATLKEVANIAQRLMDQNRSSVGSSSPVRSSTPPSPDYPFDKMAPKRTSTSTTPTMTQTAIRKLVADSIAATLEEAANIAQRLMDQVLKHNSVQGTNDHKRKFDDRRTFTNNNNNDHHQQQNRRQETFRAYAATPTKNSRSSDQELQEQGASHWKQPVTSVSNLLCL
ncbi:hypothetical protein Tco_1411793 [Tanacetum coccineum]